ncbi:MAG: hypothetical protein K940chlam9_01079, partial [Chlamydiae bacterium]|nr:hypothetical protein [Chlamydiota bacterium]
MSRLNQIREKSPRELFLEKTEEEWREKWAQEKGELDPLLTMMGKERLRRTLELIPSGEIEGKEVLDLGCGSGRV